MKNSNRQNDIAAFSAGAQCRLNAVNAGNEKPVMFYDYKQQVIAGTFTGSPDASRYFARGWNGLNIA